MGVYRLAACSVFWFHLLRAAEPVPPQFLLSGEAEPVRYSLDLTILPEEATFQGVARIEITLKRSLPVLWLNGKGITVQRASLRAGDRTIPARTLPAGDEFLGFTFDEPAGPGPALLEVHYRAGLNENGAVGAFRKKSAGDWYAFTTFTAIDARRAFPCFDEPRYKTPWQLTLHVRKEHTALANTQAASESEEPGGMKKVVFAPTPPLPSELVAFAVGPFEIVEAGKAGRNQVPVRIVTPRGRAAEAAYARTITAGILARLEEYTGIPYPFEKLDHIALLEGAFGATENPGLITYQQRILLATPERDTADRRRDLRGTMAHELAHQWFGNLVTMSGWEDVWLSEGFATWLGGKVADMDQPESRRKISAAASRDRIMGADAPAGARPVRLAMSSREAMRGVYDRVVYEKGAGTLRMLEGWLGEEPFRRAMRLYLSAHAWRNVTTADLAAALREAAGRDVSAILNSFLDQPGAPLITAQLRCGGQSSPRVILRQERYVPLGASIPSPQWRVPVCVAAEGGLQKCVVMEGQQAELVFEEAGSCPAWIFPNAGAIGYYRSELPPVLLDALLDKGFRHLTGAERLTAVLDTNALVRNSRLQAGEALKHLPELVQDPEAAVALAAAGLANSLAAIVPRALKPRYDQLLERTLGAQPAPKADEIELLRRAQERSLAEFLSR